MFSISRLFSKKNETDNSDQYTKVASLIEEGSVLDRRKLSNDRRSSIERRVRLRNAFHGEEKRSDNDRRSQPSRREGEYIVEDVADTNAKGNTHKVTDTDTNTVKKAKVSTKSREAHKKVMGSVTQEIEVEPVSELKITSTQENKDFDDVKVIKDTVTSEATSNVESLIRDQMEIIKDISDLSAAVKRNELEGVVDRIRKIKADVKNVTREEEKHLYLSFDKNGSRKSDKPLTDILFYIHDVSDQVIEYLDRYYYTGVPEARVGFFLLDMNIVIAALKQILSKKKEHLYPMYK